MNANERLDYLARDTSAKLQEIRDVFGSVPNERPLNLTGTEEDDQSAPAPWWVLPALLLVGPAAVFVLHLLSTLLPLG